MIEISDRTLTRDLGFKADLYRQAKIPEYWVVDVRNQCLRVFTPAGDRYETTVVRGGKVLPQALAGVEIDVGALFLGAKVGSVFCRLTEGNDVGANRGKTQKSSPPPPPNRSDAARE